MNLKKLIFALMMTLGLTSQAANEKKTVAQVTDAVDITEDVDYIITGTEPFTTTGSVNIVNTEHAVVIIEKIKPSVVTSKWLANHVFINGEPAIAGDLTSNNNVAGSNCQVKMYNRGAIIMPYGQKFQPLTCFTEFDFQGESYSNYPEGSSGGYMKSLNAAQLNNKFKSFKLKRGYMVTFALGTGGWGYSRCFIADNEDLEMNLPANMAGRVSSFRVFKWWNAHKAGLASDGRKEANAAVGSCWCYDWAQGNASLMPDVEWVPNHIYEDYPSSATCGGVTASCHMKTNNEPGNSADDHPQSVDVILDNWQNLMRTGMRLCSESSWDGNSGRDIYQFIDSIDKRGWRCDLIDLHCYWPSGSFTASNMQNRYNGLGKRPIWISEWVWGASWNNNGAFAVSNRSDFEGNQNNTYNGTKPILDMLNNCKYVERYSYWNSEANCSKIYLNGKLSKTGEYYATMNDGLGYDPTLQKVPTIVYSNPRNLTGTYTKSKGVFTLKWNDPNGDMLDSVCVQVQHSGSKTWKWYANVPLKDMSAKTGAAYSFDVIPEEGNNIYRIASYPIGERTPKLSGTVSYFVTVPKGTDMFQYGSMEITNENAVEVTFSEKFATTPAVFMGTVTNNNTKYFPGNLITGATNAKFAYQIVGGTKQGTGYITTPTEGEEAPFLALQDTTNFKFGELDCETGTEKVNMKDTLVVTFRNPFPEGVTPVVLTELRNPTTKTDAYTIRIWDVTNTGFKAISMYEEGVGKVSTISNNMSYMAITPGIGILDEENKILIAAGIGDSLYGTTYRQVTFKNDADTVYFNNPYIFTNLQTYNYHAATQLRRQSNITLADKTSEYNGYTYATRIKRMTDLSTTTTDKTTKAFGDVCGWVVVASYAEGGTQPTTAIKDILATQNSLGISVKNGYLNLPANANVEVYSTSGMKLNAKSRLNAGAYIIKMGNKTTKIMVK